MVITEKTDGQAVQKSMDNCSGGCAQSAVLDLEDVKLEAGIEAGVKGYEARSDRCEVDGPP